MSRPARWPPVSVVLAVRNERRDIATTLRHAAAQDYPGPLEVVVADGGSTDGTRQAIEAESARHPNIRLVANPSGSTPAGLNRAIEVATGQVIVRCDGRSRLPPGYVRRVVELLEETGAGNVGGIQRAVGEGVIQGAIALAMSIPLGVGDARFHYGGPPGPTDTVYLGAFRRDLLEEVGMFDESMIRNQDYELNVRIRRAGRTVYFHPDLAVEYRPRPDLASLWRQYFQYGRWKVRTVRLHPTSLRWRQIAPTALVVGLAASAVLAATPWRQAAIYLPVAYGSVLLAGALWTAWRRRRAEALALPVVLAVMHLAWGLGFIRGLLDRSEPGRS